MITALALLAALSTSCNKEKTCQCTATQGQDMIDMGFYTGKKSCDEPSKETQGYEGWVIKCVEIKTDNNLNSNTN